MLLQSLPKFHCHIVIFLVFCTFTAAWHVPPHFRDVRSAIEQTEDELAATYVRSPRVKPFIHDAIDLRRATESELTSRQTTPNGADESSASKPFELRILPLGASITYGATSGDGNGYRKYLRDQLRFAGWEVNMVGSVRSGNMKDNDNEGHSSLRVEQVMNISDRGTPFQPNLILINAGTNDVMQNKTELPVDKIGERMDKLLDMLYEAVPGVTIILSTLIPNNVSKPLGVDATVRGVVNPQYRQIVEDRQAKAQRIVLADMYPTNTSSTVMTQADLVADGIHPNDKGYQKMASVWWKAIQDAERYGMMQEANPINSTCEKPEQSDTAGQRIQTQKGSGGDDGNYTHASEDKGRVYRLMSSTEQNVSAIGIHFAQLVKGESESRGSELDEIVWTKDGGETYMMPNLGNGEFDDGVEIDVKCECDAKGAHWGDMDGDGLDDFICITEKGEMQVSMNRGGNPPRFESLGVVFTAPIHLNRTNVRLGDVDGDGRVDFCSTGDSLSLSCWRNSGWGDPSTKQEDWKDFGDEVMKQENSKDIEGFKLVDINGDGRSDLLHVNPNGTVTMWINNRGTGQGSIVPDWRQAGVTHKDLNGTELGNVTQWTNSTHGIGDLVRFGRVYGNQGKNDFILLEPETIEYTTTYSVHVWANNGTGGTLLKGDGVYYCDLRGVGADDYIWINKDGRGERYGNIHAPPTWSPQGPEIFNISRPRKSIHLADFDGDGKCDVWAVRESDGAVEVWINHYDEANDSFDFEPFGFVTGDANCTQGWGVGQHDLGMRFADIDGDGRADYLCIEPDGSATSSLNKGVNDFAPFTRLKSSEKKERADHRFADIDGDGLADFLYIDKFTGDTYVWLNFGNKTEPPEWQAMGKQFTGPDRGANIYFPSLGPSKQADMHQVIPRTNEAYTWFSPCPGNAEGDDGEIVDPKLPIFNTSEQQ